jgi:hypothetical protein
MSKFLGTAAFAAIMIAAGSFPADAAHRTAYRGGVSRYDRLWSLVIQTTRNCTPVIRAGVRIAGGRVLTEDASYQLDGRSCRAALVTVSAEG